MFLMNIFEYLYFLIIFIEPKLTWYKSYVNYFLRILIKTLCVLNIQIDGIYEQLKMSLKSRILAV